jgi:hypothetical protein
MMVVFFSLAETPRASALRAASSSEYFAIPIMIVSLVSSMGAVDRGAGDSGVTT